MIDVSGGKRDTVEAEGVVYVGLDAVQVPFHGGGLFHLKVHRQYWRHAQ